jgi:hypothetical protein
MQRSDDGVVRKNVMQKKLGLVARILSAGNHFPIIASSFMIFLGK